MCQLEKIKTNLVLLKRCPPMLPLAAYNLTRHLPQYCRVPDTGRQLSYYILRRDYTVVAGFEKKMHIRNFAESDHAMIGDSTKSVIPFLVKPCKPKSCVPLSLDSDSIHCLLEGVFATKSMVSLRTHA